jgi:hypothetical protein
MNPWLNAPYVYICVNNRGGGFDKDMKRIKPTCMLYLRLLASLFGGGSLRNNSYSIVAASILSVLTHDFNVTISASYNVVESLLGTLEGVEVILIKDTYTV